MSRSLFIALGGGTSAILSISFMAGSPLMLVMGNLAPLPLFLVGLGLGTTAGTAAALIGLALSGLFGGLLAAGLYGLIHALPTWLAIRQSLIRTTAADGSTVWYPMGSVLCWLTALAAAILVIVALVTYQSGEGLSDMITGYLAQVTAVLAPNLTEAERAQVTDLMVPFFPGTVGVSWLAVLAGNALLAQALLTRSGRNLRPRPKADDFILPDWISWLLVGAAALALVGSGELAYLGRNLAVILATPFFVLGVVVVHFLTRPVPGLRGVLLVAFYVVIFFSGLARLLAAGLGVIEQWVGIRRRFAKPGPLQEDE